MTSNKGTENRKAENGSRKKTPRVLLDVSSYPKDEKGNAIVPDGFFNEHLKELPDGTTNESGTSIAQKGGVLRPLGSDPERDREIRRAGAEALNAKLAQRRSFADVLSDGLRRKDGSGLSEIEKIGLAMLHKAKEGDVKAAMFIRDTVGEMPVSKQQISADITTEADRALMEKITKRLQDQDK